MSKPKPKPLALRVDLGDRLARIFREEVIDRLARIEENQNRAEEHLQKINGRLERHDDKFQEQDGRANRLKGAAAVIAFITGLVSSFLGHFAFHSK